VLELHLPISLYIPEDRSLSHWFIHSVIHSPTTSLVLGPGSNTKNTRQIGPRRA
jgi:hypothetical protein